MEFIKPHIDKIPEYIITYVPSIVLAILVFLIGRMIVRKLSAQTVSGSQKVPTIDVTLARFLGSIVLFVGMAAVIIFTMATLKINLGFLAGIVAALMAALGFALQDSLGDLAAGIMLVFFRPFQVGDEVEIGGEKGVVRDMGLFGTQLLTRDNITINVGNGAAFGGIIKNFYGYGHRRLDMDFGVSYNADLDQAIAVIKSTCEGDDRILLNSEVSTESPIHAPWAKVTSLGDSSVNIQLRLWCLSDDYRKIKMDMSHRVKVALDKAKIDIPYEHNMIIEG